MTEREALKLALEALDCIYSPLHVREINKVGAAMTAIKEALAQPEQEPVAWRWGVQKLKNGDFEWRYSLNQTRPDAIPLYTTPPQSEPVIDKSAAVRIATSLGWEPKRTWVGLTQEDIDIAFDETQEGGGFWEFADAIEAKLKEKNT